MTKRTPPIPRRWPLNTLLALALSVACFQGFVTLWQRTAATSIEAYDIQSYLKSQFLKHIPRIKSKAVTYRLHTGPIKAPAAPVAAYLERSIYQGRTWWSVLYWPLWGTGLCTVLLLVWGARTDIRYREKVRLGVYVRGTEEISVQEHNRRHPEPGFRLKVT